MQRLLVVSIILISSGCLRYTPSHQELQEKYTSERQGASQLGGEEDFMKYESVLNERVSVLLRQRAYLTSPNSQASGYPVGVGDVLEVSVFGFSNLSAQSAIATDGSLVLPLVGRIDIAGRPVDEVQSELTRRYSRYVRSPQVIVALKNPVTNRVSVMGEVSKPGTYPLIRKGMNLTEILSEAGGRTQSAGSRIMILPAPRILSTSDGQWESPEASVSLVSHESGHSDVGVEVDMEALMGTIDQRPLIIPLLPGDTIIVPEAGTYEVDGEVNTPGSYKLATRTSAIGAIAAAKGFTYSAAVNNVEVIRDVGNGKKALITLDLEEVGLRGGKDIRLRNGDLVRVPSEPGRFFRNQVVQTLNGIFSGFGVNKRVN